MNSTRTSDTVKHFYGESTENAMVERKYKNAIDSNYLLKIDKFETVSESIAHHCSYFPRAEEAANIAQELYESLNNQLVNESFRLIDLKVDYIDPTFEVLVKIQLKFCRENHDKLISLQNYFPPNDSLVDNKVQEVYKK
ncbi:hypothetical protein Glove_195g17 [Diversispora epigaea]|uniref:BAR domain-containing protein n=1 Tax=Diversispora epigaea TaxID=1348612 RepID=A0A397IVG7_9GLOM|nr:hypothetical protein Glove_195g17 [Diversispora epigaea]